MSQISPPIRIVLAVAVLFIAAWMTVLKPKSNSSAPAPAPTPAGNVNTGAPAQTNFGKAVEKAKDAAKATDKRTAKVEANDGTTDATTASGTGTTTAKAGKGAAGPGAVTADLTGVPAGVAKAIRAHHVVVLAFLNTKAADDRAVRRSLKHVDRWDGKVSVKAVPVAQVSKYTRITRELDVEQSPTVVVIDRKLKATPIVGYVDAPVIDQAVVDALRNSGGLFSSVYLRKVHATCSAMDTHFGHFAIPDNAAQARIDARHLETRWNGWVSDFRAISAPPRFRAFRRATLADAAAVSTILVHLKQLTAHKATVAQAVTFLNTDGKQLGVLGQRINKRMDSKHLLICGSNN